jgi:hypothetical protein
MANVIYRGPVASEPQTINLPVAGAYLPGTFVTSDGAELTQATTAVDQKVYLLSNRRFMEQGIADAYVADDTAVAYEVAPNEVYQARMAAATYAKGAALTVAASGRLAAAASGNPIVAYFDGTAGAVTAGAFADVIIANGTAAA